MKTAVVYRSKTGFVKKYADWIAEELSADIFDASKVSINMLTPYDNVIFGGSLHAVGINGIKLITRNLDKLKGKKLVVFASGASPFREEVLDKVRDMNFTSEQQKYIKFFYLRGGFDYGKLGPVDKVLMTLLKLKLKRKKGLSPDERGMLFAYDIPMDFTKKKNIDEIISYINS